MLPEESTSQLRIWLLLSDEPDETWDLEPGDRVEGPARWTAGGGLPAEVVSREVPVTIERDEGNGGSLARLPTGHTVWVGGLGGERGDVTLTGCVELDRYLGVVQGSSARIAGTIVRKAKLVQDEVTQELPAGQTSGWVGFYPVGPVRFAEWSEPIPSGRRLVWRCMLVESSVEP